MSMPCSVCGDPYLPPPRWQEDSCPPCFQENFRASDELRLRGEVEVGGAIELSPREVQALARFHAHHRRVRRGEEGD